MTVGDSLESVRFAKGLQPSSFSEGSPRRGISATESTSTQTNFMILTFSIAQESARSHIL